MTTITDKLSDLSASTESEIIANLTVLADKNVPAATFDTADGRLFVLKRDDFTIDNITPANKQDVFLPKFVTQAVKIKTAASMIDYVKRFMNRDTVLFANIDSNSIVASIDYHKEPVEFGKDASANHGAHTATMVLPYSEEWMTWTIMNEKLMSHVEFASFLEENAFDVIQPAGAELLETCRDLQVKQDMNFTSAIRMGEAASVSYQKDQDATSKGNISLPVSITLSIPVYFGEPPVSITAWMRRQITDGKLRLGYKLSRLESVRQREFGRVVSEIKGGCADLTTVYGIK